jgi:hypothetical protein
VHGGIFYEYHLNKCRYRLVQEWGRIHVKKDWGLGWKAEGQLEIKMVRPVEGLEKKKVGRRKLGRVLVERRR